MIVGIKGKLVSSTPLSAVIDVNGIYYEVHIPITTAERMPNAGAEVFLNIYAVYREDAQLLFGFASNSDKEFFKLLVEKVSGIGPKTALNAMSRMSVETLRGAIESGDIATLSKCPGIGKKTAERLVVELRGAFAGIANNIALENSSAPISNTISDAVAALTALGFKLADADKASRNALSKLGESASTEAIIKFALRSS